MSQTSIPPKKDDWKINWDQIRSQKSPGPRPRDFDDFEPPTILPIEFRYLNLDPLKVHCLPLFIVNQ